MTVLITQVKSVADVQGIIDLQQANLKRNLSPEAIETEGFVTLEHSFDTMKRMNDAAPSIIAKDGDKVVGYAIVMLPEFKEDVPALIGLFENIDRTLYQSQPLAGLNYVIVGQLCVGLGYRGIGLVGRLYDYYRSKMIENFDMCLTDISAKNPRSRKAHERVGFQVVSSSFDETAQDTWELIVWDWQTGNKA
jgi:hypothetical protein